MLLLLRILLWDLPAEAWSWLVGPHRLMLVLLYPLWVVISLLIVACACTCMVVDRALCLLFDRLGVEVEERGADGKEGNDSEVRVRQDDGPGFTSLYELFEGARSRASEGDISNSERQQ